MDLLARLFTFQDGNFVLEPDWSGPAHYTGSWYISSAYRIVPQTRIIINIVVVLATWDFLPPHHSFNWLGLMNSQMPPIGRRHNNSTKANINNLPHKNCIRNSFVGKGKMKGTILFLLYVSQSSMPLSTAFMVVSLWNLTPFSWLCSRVDKVSGAPGNNSNNGLTVDIGHCPCKLPRRQYFPFSKTVQDRQYSTA